MRLSYTLIITSIIYINYYKYIIVYIIPRTKKISCCWDLAVKIRHFYTYPEFSMLSILHCIYALIKIHKLWCGYGPFLTARLNSRYFLGIIVYIITWFIITCIIVYILYQEPRNCTLCWWQQDIIHKLLQVSYTQIMYYTKNRMLTSIIYTNYVFYTKNRMLTRILLLRCLICFFLDTSRKLK